MKLDKHKTEVKFLKNESLNDDENVVVFAFFPKECYYNKEHKDYKLMFQSYEHNGQHSACHIDYANESVRANKEEYQELFNELTNLGYNLEVI